MAQLIGSVKLIDPADSLDETTARAIFRYATAIGRGRNDHPTVNGWFYLIMNDDWTYSHAEGSVYVKVLVTK